LNQLVEGNPGVPVTALPDTTHWMPQARGQAEGFETLALKYDEDAKTGDRASLEKQRRDLQARKWLSQQCVAIDEEIGRLRKKATLKAARDLTNTSGLSRKKGVLSEELITKSYVERFEGELRSLGAGSIKVELVKKGVMRGHVHHQIHLRGVHGHPTHEVLSEGEHRIVSIAAFLADVSGKAATTPIVFDDPISSLDQDFEEAVVRRLVQFSRDRQVIVFTHRLSLLSLLQYAAEEVDVVCLRSERWGTGQPGGTPIDAKKPDRAMNQLRNERVKQAAKILENDGHEKYDPIAKGICSDFRILLERLIEHELLADVVQRFRRAVQTQGKIFKLATIGESDCKLFDDMMTKYSRFEHSQPTEAPVLTPLPEELEKDLDTMSRWVQDFQRRGKGL
jgi:hypothetical protein